MSDKEDRQKRAIEEHVRRERDNGVSSEQAHRRWSERARESEKTVVHRDRPRPAPRRIPISIPIEK